MFTAALFTVAKRGKQTNVQQQDEWINKTRSIHTTENYLSINRNEAGACLMGREVSFQGDEKCFGTRQRRWWYSIVKVLNAADLYTVKWLK